jgi:hypothetical protein
MLTLLKVSFLVVTKVFGILLKNSSWNHSVCVCVCVGGGGGG